MTMAVKACVWPRWRVDSDGTTVSEIPELDCPVALHSKKRNTRNEAAVDRAACIRQPLYKTHSTPEQVHELPLPLHVIEKIIVKHMIGSIK